MEDQRRLIWDEKAFLNFEESLEWISKRSIPTAEEVEKALFEKINTIRSYPERHPPDNTRRAIQAITAPLRVMVTGFHIATLKMK